MLGIIPGEARRRLFALGSPLHWVKIHGSLRISCHFGRNSRVLLYTYFIFYCKMELRRQDIRLITDKVRKNQKFIHNKRYLSSTAAFMRYNAFNYHFWLAGGFWDYLDNFQSTEFTMCAGNTIIKIVTRLVSSSIK